MVQRHRGNRVFPYLILVSKRPYFLDNIYLTSFCLSQLRCKTVSTLMASACIAYHLFGRELALILQIVNGLLGVVETESSLEPHVFISLLTDGFKIILFVYHALCTNYYKMDSSSPLGVSL